MRFALQMAVICVAGALLGLALNLASARPARLFHAVYAASDSGNKVCGASPEAQHEKHGHLVMPQKEAVVACGACTVGFVDARGAAAFAEGHIPQAVHLPPAGHPDEPAELAKLRTFPTVVVYDSGGGCGLAEGVADRLAVHGFKDVRLLEGSWTDWMIAGGPALSGACQACDGHAHDRGAMSTEAHP
ncbi:MAG: rhodanese-like domain-containing protein [Myxococcales bacterium]